MKLHLLSMAACAAALAFLAACQPAAAPPPGTPAATTTPGTLGPVTSGGFGQTNAGPATSGMGPATPQQLIVGSWRCSISANGASAQLNVSYTATGQFTSNNSLSATSPTGQRVELQGAGRGTYTIQGNQITETSQGADIIYVRLDGVTLDPSSPEYQEIRNGAQAAVGRSITSTIESITVSSMTISNSGQRANCNRV